MLDQVRARWHALRQSLWFVPGAVGLGFAALAVVLVQIDRAVGSGGVDALFGGSASAARTILSTVAASVITVAGLAFSITIITLQLVSQQFSPRATRTFLGNTPTQVSAGVFVGVFLYCLVVLRTVREEEFGEFVPGLSVTGAIVLGVVGIGVLLFFINHTAQSIKVTSITARIARETLASIDGLYPESYGEPEDEADAPPAEGEPLLVHPSRPGYVTRVGLDTLVERLSDRATRVRVEVAPGDFVTEGQPLAAVWPGIGLEQDGVEKAVRLAVLVGDEREVREDVGYGLQQLADIALRAISPSVNDPSTAVTCVGYVAACLERLACRRFPSARRRYRDGALEVVVRRADFGLFVALGLLDVGRWAPAYPRVVEALLSAAARAAAAAAGSGAAARARVIREGARTIATSALEEARTEPDRAAIRRALAEVELAAEGRAGAVRVAAGSHRPR